MTSRRKFIKDSSIAFAGISTLPHGCDPVKKISPNDKIRVGAIGAGIMGFKNIDFSLQIPGVELAGVCDLYSGRLERAKERYGKSLQVTNNYHEMINRSDIDAVIVSTSDHWHDQISIDAMRAGKAVYCEKPMVHHIEEGRAVIQTERETGQIFQVGSQGVSSLLCAKAKELYFKGEIGQLIMIECWRDRQSALGAWNYSIPTDASENSVRWDLFQGDAPKQPYDPIRFFRWRNFQDYGTGVAGDLFVHLFSELHTILDSKGPHRIYTTGGLRYWKDGRDVPDVMIGCFDYPKTNNHPAFNLQLRVNFVDGKGGGSGTRLIGSEGVMELSWDSLTLNYNKMKSAPGFGGWDSFDTFSSKEQQAFQKAYNEKYGAITNREQKNQYIYIQPEGANDSISHHKNFYNAMRGDFKIIEDASFGLRAAAPSLAANKSYFEKKIIYWDPEKMELIS